jgi:hypothetical protein
MVKLWTEIVPALRGPIVSVVVVSVGFGIVSSTLSDLLLRRLGARSALIATIGGIALVVVFVAGIGVLTRLFRRTLQRSLRQVGGRFFEGRLEKPPRKKGLILLASNPLHSRFAIDYHREQATLSSVWLIPSNDKQAEYFGPGTEHTADGLRQYCEERSVSARVMPSVSPDNAQETFDVVNRIYRTLATTGTLTPGDVIADFTGGTKPMTVGMIMACLPADRQLEYVPLNPTTGQSSGPFLIDYQHTVFGLAG